MPPEPAARGWPRGFGVGSGERAALLVLAHLDGVTPRQLHRLAWELGSARACLGEILRGRAGSEGDRAWAVRIRPGEVEERLARSGGRLIIPGDAEYPGRLLDLPDPPATLFVRGSNLQEPVPAVAMVGARGCSAYGREMATRIGRGLSDAGVTVVSGAARGIDEASHRGALSGGGRTVAVLGSGIDVPYPPRNRGLLEEIVGRGAVVSEYPPGVRPDPWRFPARNRIVAALADVVVIVEGAQGSGSMITAEFALDLGRDVYAVPGLATSPLSYAPHLLLREGAAVATGPEDVLEGLGLAETGSSSPSTGQTSSEVAGFSESEGRVFRHLVGAPMTAEGLAADAGVDLREVLAALAALELRGVVREAGGRYVRGLP